MEEGGTRSAGEACAHTDPSSVVFLAFWVVWCKSLWGRPSVTELELNVVGLKVQHIRAARGQGQFAAGHDREQAIMMTQISFVDENALVRVNSLNATKTHKK